MKRVQCWVLLIFTGKHFGWEIAPIRKEMWDMLLWILLGLCLAAAGYCLLPTVKRALQKPRETEWWPDWGRYVRVGIIAAAVVVGYCIFSVLANGCYQSEYFAEQITVNQIREDSEDQLVHCVDFVRKELSCYTLFQDGSREEHWSRPLTQEALDEFVDTCNEKALLGAECWVPNQAHWSPPEVRCVMYTYSTRGERLVFTGIGHYYQDNLKEDLELALFQLTGLENLLTP